MLRLLGGAGAGNDLFQKEQLLKPVLEDGLIRKALKSSVYTAAVPAHTHTHTHCNRHACRKHKLTPCNLGTTHACEFKSTGSSRCGHTHTQSQYLSLKSSLPVSVAQGEKLRCHVENSSWQLVKVDNGLSQDFFLLSDRATIRAWSSELRGRYEVKQLCM